MREIRALDAAGIDTVLDWAAAEGWNPGLGDAACFRAADPDGFLGAFDPTGRLLACVSAVRTGATLGFIGFYIATPDARGRGHGWAVWQAAMARLAGRSIGLDGVVAQQANYRRSGFALAWNNARHQGEAAGLVAANPPGLRLAGAEAVPFEALLAYDAAHAGAPRTAFLRAWIGAPGHRALLALARSGTIAGFGVARPCRQGTKIGPLFAADATVARALFAALADGAPCPVILDTPEPNAAALALARDAGLARVFETARMYAGAAPTIPLPQVFGVTSFELG